MNAINEKLRDLNKHFLENDKNGLPINGKNNIYIKGLLPILISAPHAVRQQRNGEIKSSDYLTGPLAIYLAEKCNCSCFVKVCNDYDDANYPVGVTLENVDSDYIAELKDILIKNNYFLVIDLHGCKDERIADCSFWSDNYSTCSKDILEIFQRNLSDKGLSYDDGSEFLGGQVTRQVSKITNAVQLEVRKRVRNLKRENVEYLEAFIKTLEKSIYDIYNFQLSIQDTVEGHLMKRIINESKAPKKITIEEAQLLSKKMEYKSKKRKFNNTIDNPLELVLDFYKSYNVKYYEMILEGLQSGKIIIYNGRGPSQMFDEYCYVFFNGDDGDAFIAVHEFAHYIDVKLGLIQSSHNYLGEVFSYYMEKKLEEYMISDFEDAVEIRRNRRMCTCSKFARSIKYLYELEEEYNDLGIVDYSKLQNKEASSFEYYNTNGDTINHLARYPLAEIYSEYLIRNNFDFDANTINELISLGLKETINPSVPKFED